MGRCPQHGGNDLCPDTCHKNAGKQKATCKTHGGTSICPDSCEKNAGGQKAFCAQHGGSRLCPEACTSNARRLKVNCAVHGGSALCPSTCQNAGKWKSNCGVHGGGAICPPTCISNTGKRKIYCAEHGGTALCPPTCERNAGKHKTLCAAHGGGSLCPDSCATNAGKQKGKCAIHGGSALCPWTCVTNGGKQKAYCQHHGGARLCVGCRTTIMQKQGTQCRTCAPVANRHARVREARMACTLQEWADRGLAPQFTLWNRQNPEADPAQCGRYRVDFVFEWEEGVVLLEYDEQMHSDRDRRCELVRQAEVSLGYGGRPVHWIRFNPDAFKLDGETRVTRRQEREAVLLQTLNAAWAAADYDHFITVDYICYDQTAGVGKDLVETMQFKTIRTTRGGLMGFAPQ